MKLLGVWIGYVILSVGMLCATPPQSMATYIQHLEEDNNISYTQIQNTRGAYIPAVCYSKTKVSPESKEVFNSCYVCHNRGVPPNYVNDSDLQKGYQFPPSMLNNPYQNVLRQKSVSSLDDAALTDYIQTSNYCDSKGRIILHRRLPANWRGYRPDCYFHFDKQGFDRDREGHYSGWRAFRYAPFPGIFWPLNGAMDDVMIRLDWPFRVDQQGRENIRIYHLNLSIVEALIKQKSITLDEVVDERLYGVDLNANGTVDATDVISAEIESYVGLAKVLLEKEKLHLAKGLYPEKTEFLHTVRYLDWDEKAHTVKLSKRMKEVRYSQKIQWKTYGVLKRIALYETMEALIMDTNLSHLQLFRGNYQEGLMNGLGWEYQGFIEDKRGDLRPQTHEETLSCMGCHTSLGVTVDSSFAFTRKPQKNGWLHWSQKDFKGMAEPKVNYEKYGEVWEYSFYLQNAGLGGNDGIGNAFFGIDGLPKKGMINALHEDISLLLYPSKQRARYLNRCYHKIVEEQSYIYGKMLIDGDVNRVFKKVDQKEVAGIIDPIIQR